jgi:hypothetical protein
VDFKCFAHENYNVMIRYLERLISILFLTIRKYENNERNFGTLLASDSFSRGPNLPG